MRSPDRRYVGALGRSLVLLGVAVGCATPPKPPELEAFEKLRESPGAAAAQKRSPELVAAADNFLVRAQQEWEDNDLYEARRDALLGQIRLKTAIAVVEQDQARVRIQTASGELAKSEEEYARLANELRALNEQVALLKRLGDERAAADVEKKKMAQQLVVEQQRAEAERQKLAQQLSAEQQRAAAADRVKAAELALKTADTVDGNTHAKPQYAAAADMLARAQKELRDGNWTAAQTSAELARQKAEETANLARPLYQQAGQTLANKSRDEALTRDASGISGITVRLERRGDVQRLVLPLHGLFVKKLTSINDGFNAVLDAVGGVLKKYPTYPVQIIGYTDNRGRPENLIALSLARAQSVFSALVNRGVDPKRLMVSGQGPAEPVSDNRTNPGRERNNRVEIVFLYN